jgi:hypothetical protein
LKTSILTTSELEWLTGNKQVSKIYEYRIRSDIKKKILIFQQLELPLLEQHGFLKDLSIFTQLSANTQISKNQLSIKENNNLNGDNHLYCENQSLGREFRCDSTLSVPRPFPYQGNALPG